mgnify:CR=1 FL=1
MENLNHYILEFTSKKYVLILIIIFVSALVGAIILKLGKKKVVYLKPKDPIIRIMRAALFVPEAKRLDELFTSMRQSGHKIALVVDEFGGVSGLMTLSKVIEQIVGTTGEEGLSPKERFITIDTDTYEIEASMSVDEANNLLELNIPEGDYETIGGFILETAQSIPSIGKRLRYGDLRMTVTSMEGNKLEKVRIRKRPNLYE